MTDLAPLTPPQGLGALAVILPLAVLMALLSTLLERSGHIRLSHWAENAGDRLRELFASRRRFEAFRFLVTLLSHTMPAALVFVLWAALSDLAPPTQAPWLALAGAILLLVPLEWLARYLVRVHAERALEILTPVYRVLYGLLRPSIFVLAPFVSFVRRDDDDDEDDDDASEDEIDAYIDVGRREGILEPEEEELVRSIVDFGDTQVKSVMTPRVEIVSAAADSDPETLAAKFFESKHSRLPLFRDSIDQIAGILHIRDLFEAIHAGRKVEPLEICQQPHYVPENKPLPVLLQELQQQGLQMAIVVDEYGGVAGLVTVEDLVEEIVGDIRDEHEEHAENGEALSGGGWRLSGRAHLEDLEDLTGADLDVGDLPYETLSGLICGELGYVPKATESLERYGLTFTVEEADERRVTLVTVAHAAAVPESVELAAAGEEP
ncbi:MAG: hemolysin family protein [Acidobacteriota bacterium]